MLLNSLIPLFTSGYKKITVVDTRYISPKILNQFIEFTNQDVLFLYSILLINDSFSLKQLLNISKIVSTNI